MTTERLSSSPPPSPVPPSPQTSRYGWRPADDDLSLEAIDWRSRAALRRADRALDSLSALQKSVEALTSRIGEADTLLSNALNGARWMIGIVAGAGLLGAARWMWLWLSTLHH